MTLKTVRRTASIFPLLAFLVTIQLCIMTRAAEAGEAHSAPVYSERECLFIAGFRIPETGCALFIDLDKYMMEVYLDGKLYRRFPVSGGDKDTPSPVGTWFVVNISDWGEGFGGTWIGLNVPWGQYGIHGTLKPWLIGRQNVSHGCIRMKNEDIGVLRKIVKKGVIVHIKQDSLPFRSLGLGMTGSDVLSIQKMLDSLGFYTGTIDGIFGSGMERAVKSFQKTYSLKVDGIVGEQTYDKIVEQYKLITESSRPATA